MKRDPSPRSPRRILFLLLLLVSLIIPPAAMAVLPDGDVDADGRVTGVDALILLRTYLGLDQMTDRIRDHGIISEIGTDGRPHPGETLTLADPLLVLQKSVRLISWDVSNRPPVIQTTVLPDGAIGAPYVASVDGSDPDRDTLRFTLQQGPDGMTIDSSTGRITWTPTQGDAGTFPVTVSLDDGQGGSTQTVYQLRIPDTVPPIVTFASPPSRVEEKIPTVITADATDNKGIRSVTFLVDGTSREVVTSPPYRFTLTPPQTPGTALTVRAVAEDLEGNSASAETVIEVYHVNIPPVIASLQERYAVAEGGALSIPVSATDPENAPLTLTATTTPENLPNASFSATGGSATFTFSPDFSQAGEYRITFIAADPAGLMDQKSVVVTVTDVNRPPAISTLSLPDGRVDFPYSSTVAASDPDGDTLVFSLVTAPPGMSVDAAAGTLSWLPIVGSVGSHELTIAVGDGKGGSDTRSLTLQVPDSVPPSVALTAPREAIPGAIFTVRAAPADNIGVASVTLAVGTQTPTDLTAPPFEQVVTLPDTLGVGATIPITATVRDAAGNSGSASASVTIVAAPDTAPPTVTIAAPGMVTAGSSVLLSAAASDDRGVMRIDFSADGTVIGSVDPSLPRLEYRVPPERAAASTVTFGATAYDFSGNSSSSSAVAVVGTTPDSTLPTIALQLPASLTIGSPLSATIEANDDRGVAAVELLVGHAPALSFTAAGSRTVSLPLPAWVAVGMELPVVLRVTDFSGNVATAERTVSIVPRGKGVLAGNVFDDATGLPLSGASVTLSLDGGKILTTETDQLGRYTLAAEEGTGSLQLKRSGYTVADRAVSLLSGKGGRVADARLTRVPAPVSIPAVLGGELRTPFDAERGGVTSALKEAGVVSPPVGDLVILVPAGALEADRQLSLLQVSAQGLPGALPPGWSPLAAFDLTPHGVDLTTPATVSLPNLLALGGESRVAVVRRDQVRHEWAVVGAAAVTADGKRLEAVISGTGQYALVTLDAAVSRTMSATVGLPLPAAPAGDASPNLQTVVTPRPKVILYRPDVTSRVENRLQGEGPLVSGTPMRLGIEEEYRFASGGRVVTTPYAQEIMLHTFGLPGGVLLADYPAVPHHDIAGQELERGVITITATLPPMDGSAIGFIGPDGGSVTGTGGEIFSAPAGASPAPFPVELTRFDPAGSHLTLPSGFTLLGGVTLDLSGRMLQRGGALSIPIPSGFAPEGEILLLTTTGGGGTTRFSAIGRGAVQDGRIVFTHLLPGAAESAGIFPGITAGGTLLFVQTTAPLGYAAGVVRGTDNRPFPGALVTSTTLPLAAISTSTGGYVLPVSSGDFSLSALDTTNLNRGDAAGTVGTGEVASADISLMTSPPRVVSITPGADAVNVALTDPIVIRLSEPVRGVGAANLTVSGPAGELSGSVELSAGGTVITFRHPAPFDSNTLHTVTLRDLNDLAGTVMAAPFISRFTSVNTAPPVPPPAGSVTATIPTNGTTTITGSQGTAGLHDTVTIVNLTSGERTPVLLEPNGGFSVIVQAGVKDRLQLEITGAGGGTTTVSLPRFQQKNSDGSTTAVFDGEGGRVAVGSTIVDVPAGAFPAGAIVRFREISEAELGVRTPPDFPFVGGIEISTDTEPRHYLNVSVPVPPGTEADETGIVAKVIDAFGHPALAMVDTAKVIDGRLTTASPPCPGITPKTAATDPDGIHQRIDRYAIMLNKDQRMRYERVLTTIYPPQYPKSDLVVQTFLMPVGTTGLPLPMFSFMLEVSATPGDAFNTLCLVLPPDQQTKFVFRDARTGEVVKTIPATTPPPGSGPLTITYVDTSDTLPPRLLEHRPANNLLSIINRSIELRFSEAIQDKKISDAIKLLDPADGNSEVEIDITLSENNSVATITPKQLPGMGKRYRLVFNSLRDLAGNAGALPFIDFYTYAPKLIFPSATSRLDRTKVAMDLGIPLTGLTQVSLADVDFVTTPADRSFDGKWHTRLIGIGEWWGSGYGYRAYTFNLDDPIRPRTLAGYSGNPKYLQKVQLLKDVSLVPRNEKSTETWRNRELHYVVHDPSKRLCIDPSSPDSVPLIARWQTENNCSTGGTTCSIRTGGCGDLAVVTGYDPVYSQLWMYDVTNFSAPDWFFGMRLLSDDGQSRGWPRRPHTPAGFGTARRFSLIPSVDMTHFEGFPHPNAFGAYVAVPGIGLELVDLGLNAPDIMEYQRVPGDPLVMNERITTNLGGLYYQDVQLVRGKVVAVAGDRSDGTGIAAIELFDTTLAGPKSMLALPHIPFRMAAVEGFLSYDGDGDGVAEPHDVAFVTGADGGLSVVEIPDSTAKPFELLAFMKTPSGTVTRHIEIDPVEKVAYIGATFPVAGVPTHGLLIADLSRLGGGVKPKIDAEGWDTRIIGRIPVATLASGNVWVRGFRIDRQRGLLYVGIDGSSTGDALAIFRIADCADLGVDFSEGAPPLPLPLEVEKRALVEGISSGLTAAQKICGLSSLTGVTMIEQGSGACIWKNSCKGNYQPGISDHDYELFFPSATSDTTRTCVIERLAEQFTDLESNEPVERVQDGYRIRFEDISFFPMSRDEFENGELNVMPPKTTTGDVTGDMGLGRQMLLLKWLLEGAYVEIPGYNLTGKDFAAILSLVRRPKPAVPPSPVLDEPSGIKRLEGFEWARLQEAELYGTGALIRFVDEAKPGTTTRHLLEKQLHKVAKAGIRGVLARMVADREGNRLVLTHANGNVHQRLECLDAPPASIIAEWTPEPCDSFEHFVASVAARSVRDARLTIFSASDIVDLVYPLYRMKAGRDHPGQEEEVNRFISRAARFITSLTDPTGPVRKVFDDTIATDPNAAQRNTNVDAAEARGKKYLADGKKQIIPRIYNRGGRESIEFAVRMLDGGEKARESLKLSAAETRHLDVKRIPDPSDPSKTIIRKIFSLAGINQASAGSGSRWVDFLVDLPEKRVEEPERKNNWGSLYYYVLDPYGFITPPTPPPAALPIPDPDGTLLAPDQVCVAAAPGLRVEQLVDGVKVDAASLYIGGTCVKVDFVVTNTSGETFTNVNLYSSIAKSSFTVGSIPAGGSHTVSYDYCPLPEVGSEQSLVIPTADDAKGKPVPLPLNVETITLDTRCPIVIAPLDHDPNPELSEVMVGGTFYRYYRLLDYRKSPPEPVKGAGITTEFVGSTFVTTNYTTDDNGYIVAPVTPSTGPEIGMAVPWSIWGITTLTASQPVQGTIRVNGSCAEPVRFNARLKMFEFEETLKAGAKIDLAATAAVGLGLGLSGGLEMGWKGVHDGAADLLENFSLGRSVSLNGSAIAKAESKMKIKLFDMASVGAQGPSAEASAKFTVGAADRFDFPLPMSDEDQLRLVGLTLNTLLESGSSLAGPFSPMVSVVARYVNDAVTDFTAAKSSQSITGAVELSGSASLFNLGLRFGNRYGVGKGLTFNLGLGGSAKANMAATIEELLRERKKVNTGELSFDADLSASLDLKTTTLESEAKAEPDQFDPNLLSFTDVWKEVAALKKLGSARYGLSTGVRFRVIQNPDENMRPELLEITYKGKGGGGVQILGNQLIDLGPGFRMNRTYSVSSPTEIYRVLNRMSNFSLLMDAYGWSYLKANPSLDLIIGPSRVAEWMAEFIALVIGNADYTENLEKVEKTEIPIGIEAGLGASVKAEIGIEAEYSHGYAREKGRLIAGRSFKLEDYAAVNHVPDTTANVAGRVIGYFAKVKDVARFIYRNSFKDPSTKQVKSIGSSQMTFASEADFNAVQGLAAFDFLPLTGPLELTPYTPESVSGPSGKPHYGIGGFEHYVPVSGHDGTLGAEAVLNIHYHPDEVAGIDPAALGLYRYDPARQDWTPVPMTSHDLSSGTVTANVGSLGIYTLAPPMPSGTITWQVESIERLNAGTPEEKNRLSVVAGPFSRNDGSPVPSGSRFHLRSLAPANLDPDTPEIGKVLTVDQDATLPWTQVDTGPDGLLRYTVEYPKGITMVQIDGFADIGTTAGSQTFDLVAP